jgi:pilus assembly protein Flp/PilA
MNLIKRLLKEEDGQGMIEYALIAALISIIAIVAILAVGPDVKDLWDKVEAGTNQANPTP